MQQKRIEITLAGKPNAGKSTLLNSLIESKLSIITPKVQTTRNVINGICRYKNTEMVFFDTPGLFTPNKGLERKIVSNAYKQVKKCNLILLIIDARLGIDQEQKRIFSKLKNKNIILALNKIDLIDKRKLLPLTKEINELLPIKKSFMISALQSDGVNDIKEYLHSIAEPSLWLYEEEQLSTSPVRFLAEEITREAIFKRIHNEIPYSIYITTDSWEEDNDKIVIQQSICVSKESQKKVIIGEGGQVIKAISKMSRIKINEMFDQTVHLFLFTKLRKNWLKKIDDNSYNFGL